MQEFIKCCLHSLGKQKIWNLCYKIAENKCEVNTLNKTKEYAWWGGGVNLRCKNSRHLLKGHKKRNVKVIIIRNHEAAKIPE